jgi:chromosomal replication initiation ATPase DnaA
MTRGQLTLDLVYRPDLAAEEFLLSDCNRTAWAAIESWERWPDRRLALIGPEGSGKTHLAAIWGQRASATRLHAAELTEARLRRLMEAPAVIVENVDRVAGLPGPVRQGIETQLFHLMNFTAAEGLPLLLTGRTAAGRWRIEQPDLASRVAAMPQVTIMPPDDAILSRLLHKLFRDRRQEVGDDLVEFLVKRMERSFAAARELVAALDHKALAERRRITRPLAIEHFAAQMDEQGRGDGDGDRDGDGDGKGD